VNSATPQPNAEFSARLIEELREHPFTRGLNDKHIQVLASCAMFSDFKAGEVIFREGEIANRFYLLINGEVSLESASAQDTDPVQIQMIGAGDVLGWSWLFPPYYWRFNAVAVTDTRAIFLYGTRLQELSEDDHDLGYELMKRVASVVINRLQAARKQLTEMLDRAGA